MPQLTRQDISKAVRKGIVTCRGLDFVLAEEEGWEQNLPKVNPQYKYPSEIARMGCAQAIRDALIDAGFPGQKMSGMSDKKLASPGGTPGSIGNLIDFCFVTYTRPEKDS